jgi:hypothetical protein
MQSFAHPVCKWQKGAIFAQHALISHACLK